MIDFELAQILPMSDGRIMEWEARGEGPPLIWVEGGPGFWAHLARPDVDLVADLFHCHLVNAPGCGRTSPPPEVSGYSLPNIIAFWEAVREELGFERVTVMGHSWGGLVAAAWAAAHPESVERLIVIDGYPGGGVSPEIDSALTDAERERALARHATASWFRAACAALEDGDVDAALDEEAANRRFDPAWPLYFADPGSTVAAPHLARIRTEIRMNLDMERAWFGQPERFDDVNILPALGDVACPSLVIVGEHDFICGPEWNRPIASAIHNARYIQIPDAGHVPQYEQPDRFRTALIEWLAATRDGG